MRLIPTALLAAACAGPLAAQATDPLSPRTKGRATAPITVYEMSDFQCPFCRRHALQTFPLLEQEYIATGKVRWIFINFPLTSIHPNAVPAAEFAVCAGRQGKFWPAHDLIFRSQETWAPLRDPAPFLLSLADSLGLGRPALTACLADQSVRELIRSDAQGAVRAGASSTPSFWIEGGFMVGAHPIETFRQILDSIYALKTRPGR